MVTYSSVTQSHLNVKILNDESVIIIPEGTEGLSDERLFLPTYLSDDNRTHLLVIPAQSICFSSYFSSVRSIYGSVFPNLEPCKFNEGLYCKWFASKLHSFTHFTLPDMVFLCKRAKIMTPALKQALVAISKCTSCRTTGKKISFYKLLWTFNDHVQVDFLFIRELGKEHILHVRDKATWILRQP